ncbi:uncharacterized protein Bfra_001920 [Botrytis fragariae]|uniref:Uncharacterized protein n=1 Tax=Botrytis fragariae TaxID=1964551 RepID=A0A8H6B166_9HELO|nr:uncharacterized protein Bfra_001920 [Botrytis fragariae]KAF5877553.1 hypothetical protein Bfra_001920 [Botrytis fragariae]
MNQFSAPDSSWVQDARKLAEKIENPIRMDRYSRPCCSSYQRNMIHRILQHFAAHPCQPQTLVLAILTSTNIQGGKFMRDPVGNLVGPTRSFH